MRRVQMRGGARWPHARRTRVGGVWGHVWAPQTKVRRPDCLARYVGRRSRAPYFRRWDLLIALAGQLDVVEHWVAGAADLVFDEAPARRAVELPELDARVDEALRVADQRIGGLDRPIEAQHVGLVVVAHRAERMPAARARELPPTVAGDQIQVFGHV